MRGYYSTLSLCTLCLAFGYAADARAGGTEHVTICHVPNGQPSNFQTLRVGAPAADSHLANHADLEGDCNEHLGQLCSDGDACTVDYDEDGCIVPTEADCSDPDEATADGCDPATGCTNVVDAALCGDGSDNDADGLVDCDDPDCASFCTDQCVELGGDLTLDYIGCGGVWVTGTSTAWLDSVWVEPSGAPCTPAYQTSTITGDYFSCPCDEATNALSLGFAVYERPPIKNPPPREVFLCEPVTFDTTSCNVVCD